MPESLPQPILIVDSDEQSINHISSGLKDKGFLVITAPDGYDGYVRAKNEAPKVIIVNDLLPYVSGFKLSKLIKSDDRHTDTKIIIMSNTTGPAIDKMFKQSNADNMIEKPFQLKDIITLLEKIMRISNMIAKELYPFMQIYAVIIGLVVGSFLNVIIYRLPNNKSIIKPRSKCNGCGKQIAWYDNIPVLSYIALLAKCRNCKSPISIRYPLVEFICGMMALMLLNIYGPSYEFLVVVLLCFMLIAITFIDVDHFVIPNEFIIFGFIISIISHTFNLLPISIMDGIYGFLTFGGTLFIMGAMGTFIFKKEAMGFGDVKLGFVLGSFLGSELSLLALFLSFVFGGFMSLILLIAKEVSDDHMVPFGPAIAAGTLLTILTKTVGGGNYIINWYFTNMWNGEYFF